MNQDDPFQGRGNVAQAERPRTSPESLLTADDLYLFNQGTHVQLYNKLGAHPRTLDGAPGVQFAVWAPNAKTVTVEAYGKGSYPLGPRADSGIWEGFVPELAAGTIYKYRIVSRVNGYLIEKADPFAFYAEMPPKTASIVHSLDYDWQDREWMTGRASRNSLAAPIAIYEMHAGSWRRRSDGGWLSYRELAAPLVEHLTRTGFTHVEFLPLGEHPFYGSWG
ncbi:MAG TPA: 1,4-alpha-glucan branching enzyme, partial [Pirellulales bacterium]|nr:1,4-alpha-glucan branching enzyme [Pirellulales bacterium]